LQPCLTDAAILERITVSPDTARQLDETVANTATPPVPAQNVTAVPVEHEAAPIDVAVFGLPDAIKFGLDNSPRLRVAAEAVARARGQEQVAFSPFLPEFDYLARYGATSPNQSPGSPGPVGGIIPSGDRVHEFAQAELDLQWTVWDFGRTAGRYGQAVSRERIAALRLARARQTVAYDVTAAYLNLLLARASRVVQEQAVRRARAILEDTRARRKGGVADPDDVLRAEVQLAESREALVVADQAVFDAVARLNYAMGRHVSLPLRVADWRDRPAFTQSLTECLQTAATQRQEVAVAREAVAEARHGLRAAEADFCPRVYVRADLGHVDGAGIETGWQEGAAIHMDGAIYTGGRRTGEEKSAEADVRAAVANAQAVCDSVSLEVNVAFRAVAASRERIALTETAVAQARENLRLVRVKYRNGNATPTDVVDAETAATRSDQRYYAAVYDYLGALARLEYAMGTPQGCLGEQPPRAAEPEALPAELPPPRKLPDE
jgi:outer membrane protein TolC